MTPTLDDWITACYGIEAKAQVNLKTCTHDIKLGLKLQVAGYFPEKLGSGSFQ